MKPRSRPRALLVAAVVLAGAILALPNFFPSAPVLQISRADGRSLEPGTATAIVEAIDADDLAAAGEMPTDEGLLLSFETAEARRHAAEQLAAAYPDHVVAFSSRAAVPAWLERLGLRPVSLGLDLRGGLYFLYETNLERVTQDFVADFERDLSRQLREQRLGHTTEITDTNVHVEIDDGADIAAVRAVVAALDPGRVSRAFDVAEDTTGETQRLVLSLRPDASVEHQRRVMEQNVLTLRNRIDELGLSEPSVTRSGFDRIQVQMPGVQDPAQIRRILGSTATIEWRLQDTTHDATLAERSGRVPPGSILRSRPDGTPVLLRRDVIATGEHLNNAQFTYVDGAPVVSVRLDGRGAGRMLEATQRNLGRPLAVLLVEERRKAVRTGEHVEYRPEREESVIFLGPIGDVFSHSFVLKGLPIGQAQDLAVLLRSGALAAPVYEVRHGTVGPTLAQENIRSGRNALILGFLAVVVFMGAYYRTFGWIANCALVTNLLLLLGLLSALSATLTLPGIAGIVLTVGMAVDANVLIFERIREHRRAGKPLYTSIDAGYRGALSTIADANVTTLIAACAMFMLGTGPMRGFAITLALGIATSMFTSILGTRVLVDAIYARR